MPDFPIAEDMTDNEALRYMVAELRVQNDNLLGRYASIIGSKDIAVPEVGPITLVLSGLSVGATPIIGGVYPRADTVIGVGYETNVVHNGAWVFASPLIHDPGNPSDPAFYSFYHLFKFADNTYILCAVGTGYAQATNRWESASGIGGTYVPHGLFTNTGTYGVPVATPGEVGPPLVVRPANLLAIKTIVTNQGAGVMGVYENDFLMALLEQYETWVSPLTGRGEIGVAAITGAPVCAIATYLSA